MTTAQAGIFRQGTRYHYFLEYSLRPGVQTEALRAALAESGLSVLLDGEEQIAVLGFGDGLWRDLAGDAAPDQLRPFAEISGQAGTAPATQRDLWIWLHGTCHDRNMATAMAIDAALSPVAERSLDRPAFVYLDSRDLTGFIDGTENPAPEEAPEVALIAEGPGRGGGFVLAQQWVHNLKTFNELPVSEQENVIGRTKPDSIQLARDVMPKTSHVSRSDAEYNGKPAKMWRRSVPYGDLRENGLYFVAFASEIDGMEFVLQRMFGVTDDGLSDRLTEFSRPVSGSYFFTPSREDLKNATGL